MSEERSKDIDKKNEDSIEVDQITDELGKISRSVCNLYSRIWAVTSSCYLNTFNSSDPSDRTNIVDMANELFTDVVRMTNIGMNYDDDVEESFE
tara:strand:- start:63 stop:344 length:282 start_codon:yes stop_codon:yes gene_type:complete